MEELQVRDRPCPTCPYNKATPLGVWHLSEYMKLPLYDGEMIDQANNKALRLFDCHYNDGCLCRGWLDVHGPLDLLAIRCAEVIDKKILPESAYTKAEDVDYYESGKAVLAANFDAVTDPDETAKKAMGSIQKKRIPRPGS